MKISLLRVHIAHLMNNSKLTWVWSKQLWLTKDEKISVQCRIFKNKIDFKNIEYLHKIKSDDFERDPQYIPMYKLLPQLTIRDNDLNKLIQHYRRMLSYRYFYIQWIFSLLFVFFGIYDIRFPVKTRRLFTAHGHKFKRHHAFLIYLLLWD